MNSNSNNSPMLKVTGLWQKTSVKGGQYLTGRWGGLKILIMENRDRKSDDDPSHNLLFTEAPDRRQGAGERPQERSGGAGATHPPRTPPTHSAAHGSGFQGHRDRVPDHNAPLHRDGQPSVRDVLDDAPEWAR
jgi:hypothetical protein